MPLVTPSIAVAIPTLNAARYWDGIQAGLDRQTLRPKHILILDSTSSDGTSELAHAAGYEVFDIPKVEFNHGGTRQLAVERISDVDIVVFMTQDASLAAPDSLLRLVEPFEDKSVGATYGRQVPRKDAKPIEAHARIFNYPAETLVKTWETRETWGIKAVFLSNSFSAYRRSALLGVGGFPTHTIIAEDALVAGKMLKAGWKIVYAAAAEVEHSHHYSIGEEFSRYFDTGVYHSREMWLLKDFGGAGNEGKRFMASELKYLLAHAPYLIPASILRTIAKAAGYELGRREADLPASWRRRLSMQKRFWDRDASRPRA